MCSGDLFHIDLKTACGKNSFVKYGSAILHWHDKQSLKTLKRSVKAEVNFSSSNKKYCFYHAPTIFPNICYIDFYIPAAINKHPLPSSAGDVCALLILL